jgi:phosphohistidine phosphatase
MELYLIRHAEASALGEHNITDDALRPLTERGEKQAKTIGRGLSRRGIQLNKLLTSPLVRARQTAEILVQDWKDAAPKVIVCDELIPDSRPKKLAKYLRRMEEEHVGLVGHSPHLNILASWLIGSKKAQVEIAKAGIAFISCDDAPGRGLGALQWLVTPEWFEDMKG